MRKFAKIAAPALIAAVGLGATMPASAAPVYHRVEATRADNHRFDNNGRAALSIRVQIDRLDRLVNRSDRRDGISWREARGLRQDVWRLRRDYAAYSRHGLSDREARTLQHRIDRVNAKLRYDRSDHRDEHRSDRR